MKRAILFLVTVVGVHAQWIVNDPVNTAVNTAIQAGQKADHLEILRQWALELEKLNQQLQAMKDELAVEQELRNFVGNPSAAGGQTLLRELGAQDLARNYGDTLQAVRRLAYDVETLHATADGIFTSLEDRTALGSRVERQRQYYRRFAAVEEQAVALEATEAKANRRSTALQAELAATLEQMKAASTLADVEKLSVKVAALNGQIAEAAARRSEAADQLRAQEILVENQAAKERQDLLERQSSEERQSAGVMDQWQEAIQVKGESYTR